MNKCLNCKKPAKNKFCSRSCSSAYNGRKLSKETRKKLSECSKKKRLKRITVKKTCPLCNKEFEVERIINKDGTIKIDEKEKRFCSYKCSNVRVFTEEQNLSKGRKKDLNIRWKGGVKRYTCINCDKKIGKTKYGLCRKCLSLSKEYRENLSNKQKEKVKNGTHKGWQSRNIKSYAEKFFINVLKNNNLIDKCIIEHTIKKRDLGLSCDANYFLDFCFPEKKIDLEIDGKQHLYEDRLQSDKVRDKVLTENGYKVYRIKWKNPINKENKTYIKLEIEKFLKFYRNVG